MMRSKLAVTLLVGSIMAMPSPALAYENILIYRYKFYSDASYTQQIGEDEGYCAYFGPAYTHTGQNSPYVTADPIAYCTNDNGPWEYAPL